LRGRSLNGYGYNLVGVHTADAQAGNADAHSAGGQLNQCQGIVGFKAHRRLEPARAKRLVDDHTRCFFRRRDDEPLGGELFETHA
jgi:hypothetical protein